MRPIIHLPLHCILYKKDSPRLIFASTRIFLQRQLLFLIPLKLRSEEDTRSVMAKKKDLEETKPVFERGTESSSSEKVLDEFPEDERCSKFAHKCRLWLVLVGCCALHFLIFGMHYSFGAMFTALLSKFNKGQGQTAWVGSLASGSLFFWALFSVKLCNITSVSFTCLCGSVIAALGLILTSTANKLEILYITHSFLFGLGTSLMYTPSLIIIARFYGKWRSVATGVVVSCGSLGQLVLSPLLNFCTVSYGVSSTFRWCGFIFAVLSILSSLSFYLLDGKENLQRRQTFNAEFNVTKRLFKNKAFILWVLTMMICNFTYYIPLIHLSYYAEEIGAGPQTSSFLLTAIAASAMLGRVFFGKLSNTKPEMTIAVYQLCMFTSGLVTLFSSMSNAFWHLVLYSIAYGFLDGSFIGLISIVTMHIVGIDALAQAWAIMLFSISLPIALGPPAAGWMNDNGTVDGRALFYLSGTPMIVGSVLMILIRKWQTNKRQLIEGEDTVEEEYQTMLQLITVL